MTTGWGASDRESAAAAPVFAGLPCSQQSFAGAATASGPVLHQLSGLIAGWRQAVSELAEQPISSDETAEAETLSEVIRQVLTVIESATSDPQPAPEPAGGDGDCAECDAPRVVCRAHARSQPPPEASRELVMLRADLADAEAEILRWPRCPAGCRCRVGTSDADALECGCDGPCTTGWDAPELAEREPDKGDVLGKRFFHLASEFENEAANLKAAGSVNYLTRIEIAVRIRAALDTGQPSPHDEPAQPPASELTVVLAGERERIAAYMDRLATNYPESAFPPASDSRDAIGGTAMRHAYLAAARMIRAANTGLESAPAGLFNRTQERHPGREVNLLTDDERGET